MSMKKGMQISSRAEDNHQAILAVETPLGGNGLELYCEMAVQVLMSYCQYDWYLHCRWLSGQSKYVAGTGGTSRRYVMAFRLLLKLQLQRLVIDMPRKNSESYYEAIELVMYLLKGGEVRRIYSGYSSKSENQVLNGVLDTICPYIFYILNDLLGRPSRCNHCG